MGKIAETVIAIRGGGDIATGVIQKLYHAGFKVVILETAQPLAIRRTVAACNAVFWGKYQVEDLHIEKIQKPEESQSIWQQDKIPLLIDPEGKSLTFFKPMVVVDAILAKKNLGTNIGMAPFTVALGPGFTAAEDVDVVVETMRGHNLGRLFFSGKALANTGVPGKLGGKSAERVVHSPAAGKVKHVRKIGDHVKKDELLFYVGDTAVYSPLEGTLRGEIAEDLAIPKGLKCADVDPRPSQDVDCFTISDKARALGGAVLEAVMMYLNKKTTTTVVSSRS
ncbi:selenium-dependent molybdenum cofactor biosynthesis protein YqeB [Tetragenococcus halophilus]|uniref:Molybdenum hydroxylase n=1 Tax=Tetragenococcus halophilus TaxID=51669 RepID=A0A3G5FLP0_TETHA|nr:selenium-dependent molybdenum cofactor biosynthesis protein YqeB [Tetragenococcus halophilus]AYW51247.1 molybdenum hydroxylase [Tetragenococcus halophilus]MCF1600959.1 EF2563 family selenium-dependent molybdenum hydroxylase system protein [Tetragenococcus halophilus]MDN5830656.1 EF2563 family selenium-dependent molybdenum hydroxylase system protein [Tetragenococcus halophilus]MDN6164443.1 EF2563 family selenium-dependent molybdenum hydroxylase system protein [Tetragenococcus halophilus]MDN6